MIRLIGCFILVCALFSGKGQELTGIIKDAIDGEPLVGANVILDDSLLLAVTDVKGTYKFDKVAPGRHQLTVSYIGYKSALLREIWIKNGKVTTESINLNRDYTNLSEVVVTEPVRLSEIGKLTISEEQINRFAATYYDPARLVTISPDVAISNDQNNQISVRGISPNYNTWRLEGVEIVNPNHLSNAGTFSDQPTSNGGGVNVLSAQMLDNSSFLYSGFSADYGNSVGGIFDMGLKKGNKNERQYTAQASLIGLDFSAEGPFSKDSKVSYIANYRYSFTGLLSLMGVDFGGESIGFQDLSLNINVPLSDKGNLSFFGVGGVNFNNFNAKPLDESEIQKDRSDIYFDSKMGVVGAHLKYYLLGGAFDLSLASSGSNSERVQNSEGFFQFLSSNTNLSQSISSLNSKFRFKLGQGTAEIGTMVNYYHYDYNDYYGNNSATNNQWLYNPYLKFEHPLFNFMKIDLGLRYNIGSGGNQNICLQSGDGIGICYNRISYVDNVFDPRVNLTFFLGETANFYLSGGRYSQMLNPSNYYFVYQNEGGDFYKLGGNYDFISTMKYIVGFQQKQGDWSFTLEGFYYDFPNVNVNGDLNSNARSQGASLFLFRSFSDHWYTNFGGSMFNSTWGGGINNRFNLKNNVNVSWGKEWNFDGKSKNRSLGVNAKFIYQGGMVEPVANSSQTYLPSTNNSDYLRLDLRVQWTRYYDNRTTSFSLDIQNVTNRENDAYQYLDYFTNQQQNVTQLGLIPILTYRVEF